MVFLEAGVRNFCDCVASNVHCFGMKGGIYVLTRESFGGRLMGAQIVCT
jgi:hypothetical protein